MESQKISVAKAGITATLQCRCSMLAAANPKYGRFDMEGASITSQIDLPPALMSRFDLIFVLTDKPDAKKDRELTSHILNVHRRGEVRQIGEESAMVIGVDVKKIREETYNLGPTYDQEIMRKYVAYSKRIVPVMTDAAVATIEDNYLKIRAMGAGQNDSVPITARQLEAYVRLSEASARMRLSRTVEVEDATRAVDLVEYYLGKILAPDGSGTWDIDRISSNFAKKDRDTFKIILNILRNFGSPEGISEEEVIQHALNEGLPEDETRKKLKVMMGDGTLYKPKNGHYREV
jgi:replicative DNA helicase Mcm